MPTIDPLTNDRLLTRKEVAARYPGRSGRALSACAVKRWSSRGVLGVRLPVVYVGGLSYVRESDLAEWLLAVARARRARLKRPPDLPRDRTPERRARDVAAATARLKARGLL